MARLPLVHIQVWDRLRDESDPRKKLQRMAARPDFKRKILRAFARCGR